MLKNVFLAFVRDAGKTKLTRPDRRGRQPLPPGCAPLHSPRLVHATFVPCYQYATAAVKRQEKMFFPSTGSSRSAPRRAPAGRRWPWKSACIRKSRAGRKRAPVRRFQNQMRGVGEQRFLGARRRAPEQEHNRPAAPVQKFDHAVGKRLPADSPHGSSAAAPDGQDRVEQQNAPLSPAAQVAALGARDSPGRRAARQNILQRRRQGHARIDREAQAVGLARAMVRVLAEDDGPHLFIGRCTQGAEHLLRRRIALRPAVP